MSDKDTLQRFIFETAPVRGEFIHLHDSFQTIISQHDYPPAIKQLLGEALCVAGLLSAIIKFDGRLTVQFRGKGNLKLLLAQCDNQFHIRGLAKWDGDLTYAELMDAFNDGILVIMLDSGPNKKRYQGVVSWRGSSLTESIEGYFKDSEQLATKIWLAVNDTSAAGFMLQSMPGQPGVVLPSWDRLARQTHVGLEDILQLNYQALLSKFYPDEEIRAFPGVPVKFHCPCSRRRSEDAIALLGREEAEAELKNNHTIVVTCDFCNKEYVFDPVDVAKIFEDKHRGSSQTHLH